MDIEQARFALDEAIGNWLKANGLSDGDISMLDYSYIDNELNDLLNMVTEVTA